MRSNRRDYLKDANEFIELPNTSHEVKLLQYGGGDRILFHFSQKSCNIVVIFMFA
jgi:hypothetical protein